ncbi:MAG: adenosine kinase [Thermosynechococcaceae cyanobacterium]
MTQYDVYGLGNALVDIECEVKPELLTELGIDKGVMTLIDEDHQHKILASLNSKPLKRASGGSAANTMIAVNQFGGKSFYSCKVANDEAGQFYLSDLLACGVDTNLKPEALDEGVTGKCLVFVTPDADRSMTTFLGISGGLSEAELDRDAIASAQYTYMEGYLVTGPDSKAAAIKAREIAKAAGQKVSLTLSDFNMVKFFKEGLIEMIGPGVDFLFANESEALGLTETEDFGAAVEHFKTLATCFAITRGPKGSVIFDGDQLLEIDPLPVKAVDTVGAGDMYAGAVLYGITNGMSFANAGRLGSLAAARLVTNLGPRMETEATRALLDAI